MYVYIDKSKYKEGYIFLYSVSDISLKFQVPVFGYQGILLLYPFTNFEHLTS